jgi:hypothetical protein
MNPAIHAGSTAAHQAAKQKQQEEEEMTNYSDKDLQHDWEFKIVRSSTGAFSKREKIEQVVAEEAPAGWVMVEKFDDNRIRFKRPAAAKRNDFNLPPHINPYRTTFGMSDAGLAFTIIGTLALAGGVIFLLVYLLS